MNWVRFLFGFQGRINRLQAMTGLYGFNLLMMAIIVCSLFIVEFMPGEAISATVAFLLLFAPYMVLTTASQIAIAVRRAHDVGLSGWVVAWWALLVAALVALQLIWPALDGSVVEILLLAPTVLVAFSLFLLPGQPLANRFGDPPRAGWWP